MGVQRLVGNPETDYTAMLNQSVAVYVQDLLSTVSKIAKKGFADQCMLAGYTYAYEYTKSKKPNLSAEEVGKVAIKAYFKEKKGSTLEDTFFWGVAYYIGDVYLKDVERQKIFKVGGKTIRPDFTWDYLKLIVECDGEAYHSTPEQISNDRRKTEALTNLGYTVVRYSYKQIMNDPMETFTGFKEIYTELKQRRNRKHG